MTSNSQITSISAQTAPEITKTIEKLKTKIDNSHEAKNNN
jgi:hypothetical protein